MAAISTRDIARCYLLVRKLDVPRSQFEIQVKARNPLCMQNNNLAVYSGTCYVTDWSLLVHIAMNVCMMFVNSM